MSGKRRISLLAGGGAVAIAAALFLINIDGSPPHQPETVSYTEESVDQVAPASDATDAEVAGTASDDSAVVSDEPVPYADEFGVVSAYGSRIRFTDVADCSETFVQSTAGDWLATQKCGPTRLEVDHPYGTYTIEQLEMAANEMNDADAAYILAERFASETWRDRRGEAHAYYLKAFLLTSDSEIYERMLGEMGLHGAVRRKNGELDVANLSANYTMYRVGQMFGVVEDSRVEALALAAGESDLIDLALLDQQAENVYESLRDARGRRVLP